MDNISHSAPKVAVHSAPIPSAAQSRVASGITRIRSRGKTTAQTSGSVSSEAVVGIDTVAMPKVALPVSMM